MVKLAQHVAKWYHNLYPTPSDTPRTHIIGPLGFTNGVVHVIDNPGMSDEELRQIAAMVLMAPEMYRILQDADYRHQLSSDLGRAFDAVQREIQGKR